MKTATYNITAWKVITSSLSARTRMTTLTASEPPTLSGNTIGPLEYHTPQFVFRGSHFACKLDELHSTSWYFSGKKGEKPEGLQKVLYHLCCIDTFGIRQDIAMTQHLSLHGGTVARDKPSGRCKPSGWRTEISPPCD